jgi:hypothetical protein
MIRCVVYLLQIFKMFHGLMNNPVFINKLFHCKENSLLIDVGIATLSEWLKNCASL